MSSPARPGRNALTFGVRVLTTAEFARLERELRRARSEVVRQRKRAELWRHRALRRAA